MSGSKDYNFDWTASFDDDSTIIIDTELKTEITDRDTAMLRIDFSKLRGSEGQIVVPTFTEVKLNENWVPGSGQGPVI